MMLFAGAALAIPEPMPEPLPEGAVTSSTWNLEKRCQGTHLSYCDNGAIRCCAGLWCCHVVGVGGQCINSPSGNPDPSNCLANSKFSKFSKVYHSLLTRSQSARLCRCNKEFSTLDRDTSMYLSGRSGDGVKLFLRCAEFRSLAGLCRNSATGSADSRLADE
ncbi:hypothetical protein QBC47DRAFT_365800 [Echria macrotheca]|uniref:Uncharacterized protein n=1 Tax=Echria macrotheca TaxID=438768 RepID=A0AAJ0B127_9PEZI|nr:hypothetical protein QBC47DRAFT_365800 [Echria macrotheca]